MMENSIFNIKNFILSLFILCQMVTSVHSGDVYSSERPELSPLSVIQFENADLYLPSGSLIASILESYADTPFFAFLGNLQSDSQSQSDDIREKANWINSQLERKNSNGKTAVELLKTIIIKYFDDENQQINLSLADFITHLCYKVQNNRIKNSTMNSIINELMVDFLLKQADREPNHSKLNDAPLPPTRQYQRSSYDSLKRLPLFEKILVTMTVGAFSFMKAASALVAPPTQQLECHDNMEYLKNFQGCDENKPFDIQCPPCHPGTCYVIGTEIYTTGSSLCCSAAHDGRFPIQEGGTAKVACHPRAYRRFKGSTHGGLTSHKYAPRKPSYVTFENRSEASTVSSFDTTSSDFDTASPTQNPSTNLNTESTTSNISDSRDSLPVSDAIENESTFTAAHGFMIAGVVVGTVLILSTAYGCYRYMTRTPYRYHSLGQKKLDESSSNDGESLDARADVVVVTHNSQKVQYSVIPKKK